MFAADKALDLGRGGISRLSALTGLSRTTITKAVEELEGCRKLVSPEEGGVRQVGGGRKRVEQVDPAVPELLKKILEETTAGDPMSLLRWTSKSTRTMAEELWTAPLPVARGHPIFRQPWPPAATSPALCLLLRALPFAAWKPRATSFRSQPNTTALCQAASGTT